MGYKYEVEAFVSDGRHHGDDNYFDRTVCAEPCGTMHTRCSYCNVPLEPCAHEAVEDVPAPAEPPMVRAARTMSAAMTRAGTTSPPAPAAPSEATPERDGADPDMMAMQSFDAHERANAVEATPDVPELAREVHRLIRNGKDIPYADAEERRYYELIAARWIERFREAEAALVRGDVVTLDELVPAHTFTSRHLGHHTFRVTCTCGVADTCRDEREARLFEDAHRWREGAER